MMHREPLPFREHQLREVASRVSAGEQLLVWATPGTGRSRFLGELQKSLDTSSVLVKIHSGVDQAERCILEMADALHDKAVLLEVDQALRENAGTLHAALESIERHLEGQCLLVDDSDKLSLVTPQNNDLGQIQTHRARELYDWLVGRASVRIGGHKTVGESVRSFRLDDSPEPPATLCNGAVKDVSGIWEAASPDVRSYELLLTHMALRQEVAAPPSFDAEVLRDAVYYALPSGLQRALEYVGLHARMMPMSIFEALLGENARLVLNEGQKCGLFVCSNEQVIVDREWGRWLTRNLSPTSRSRLHQDIAKSFSESVRPRDPEAARQALSLVEAYRHFALAGDYGRAKEFARYGAGWLIEQAREASFSGDFAGAAHIYEGILQAAEANQIPIEQRLRGYARHYMHYNRAKAGTEGYRDTEVGYCSALSDWSDNALFWSRLIRVNFYQGATARALETFKKAQREVPHHPHKYSFLIARTARGLLDRNLTEAALMIWDDYQPHFAIDDEAYAELESQLLRGWNSNILQDGTGSPPLVLHRDTRVRFEKGRWPWRCFLTDLDIDGTGQSPIVAYQKALSRVRSETVHLMTTFTHHLSEAERLKKARLLSMVDIDGSFLTSTAREFIWIFGDLVRNEKGQVQFRSGGSFNQEFEVPTEFDATVDGRPRFACVASGPGGIPIGPVLRLEWPANRSEDDLLQEWRSKVANVD